MTEFVQLLRNGVDQCGLTGSRILLGVSGGADSVALLLGMIQLKEEFNFSLSVLHVNHKLHRDNSDRDAEWVAKLCETLSARCLVDTRDVREIAAIKGKGIEETARIVRYECFEQTAKRLNCTHICTAHTADDQAETILHHIVRGTGISGLRGMPVIRTLSSGLILARPLLTVSRGEVEEYLRECGQDFCIDVSNADRSFTRNRIRSDLLPLLEQQYNPQVRNALNRLGQHAVDVEAALDELANQLIERAVEDRSAKIVRLNCDRINDQPRHLVRVCFVRLWDEQNWPRQKMGFEEWDSLADLVWGDGTITFPGKIEARRRGNLLALRQL